MSAIGLHYPRLTFEDEAWLKAAVLYWPKLARLDLARPNEDCEAARQIRGELDFFLDMALSPRAIDELGASLSQLLDQDSQALVARYDLRRMFPDAWFGNYGAQLDPAQQKRLRWVHVEKMHDEVWGELCQLGLAIHGPRQLVGMHPTLAVTYLCALAGITAEHNNLEPVTDEADIHGALTSWDPVALRAALLDPVGPMPERDEAGLAQSFTTLAIESVLAADLAHVPVERIIAARKELGDEMVAFREFVRGLSGDLSELIGVEDPRVLQAHLGQLVDTQVQPRLRALEKGMRRLKLEPIRAVLSWKDIPVPAVVAGAAALGGIAAPVTVAVTGAALTIGATVKAWRRGRELRAESPVGYLLDLKRRLPAPTATAAAPKPRRGLSRLWSRG